MNPCHLLLLVLKAQGVTRCLILNFSVGDFPSVFAILSPFLNSSCHNAGITLYPPRGTRCIRDMMTNPSAFKGQALIYMATMGRAAGFWSFCGAEFECGRGAVEVGGVWGLAVVYNRAGLLVVELTACLPRQLHRSLALTFLFSKLTASKAPLCSHIQRGRGHL